MNPDRQFWAGKRVFLTGHTGFKGSWLSLWLQDLGAQVTGYALAAPTTPSLFASANVAANMVSIEADIRDLDRLTEEVAAANPDIVMHLAAQPLVRYSYDNPIETYQVNVMGTANLLEAIRRNGGAQAVVCITTDKCYENREWDWGYRENEPMGGHDPYSSSKGCSELVISAYRRSYFDAEGAPAVASARAGNVIGGGDWAEDRLIPDMMRAMMAQQPVVIRNPNSIRPWQHVIEPLCGYLVLAEQLCKRGSEVAEGWNFGPRDDDAKPVGWIVDHVTDAWGDGASWDLDGQDHPHEAQYLKLDISKAANELGHTPRLSLEAALGWTVDWYKAFKAGEDMGDTTRDQIRRFESLTD